MEDAEQSRQPPIWTLVCPINNAIFEEPVVASDGRTYTKQGLLSLMASCAERGLLVTVRRLRLGTHSRRSSSQT